LDGIAISKNLLDIEKSRMSAETFIQTSRSGLRPCDAQHRVQIVETRNSETGFSQGHPDLARSIYQFQDRIADVTGYPGPEIQI